MSVGVGGGRWRKKKLYHSATSTDPHLPQARSPLCSIAHWRLSTSIRGRHWLPGQNAEGTSTIAIPLGFASCRGRAGTCGSAHPQGSLSSERARAFSVPSNPVLSAHGEKWFVSKKNLIKMLWFSSKDNPATMLARSNPAAPSFKIKIITRLICTIFSS